MFVDTLFYITSPGRPNDVTIFNAILESSLVHARNLIDFFSAKRVYESDIHVSDFDVKIVGLSGRVCGLFKGHPEKQRIQWQVCHLTRQRFEDVTKKEWSRDMVIGPLLPALRQFLSEVIENGDLMEQSGNKELVGRISDLLSPTALHWQEDVKWVVATAFIDSPEVITFAKGSVGGSTSMDAAGGGIISDEPIF